MTTEELKIHTYLKYLIVEKYLSHEEDDYDSYFDEDGRMSVRNSLNDKNPKYYIDCVRELISIISTQSHTSLFKEMQKMKKRSLRSPRSIGDNESTVDVSSGYNQAIDDIIALLRAELTKKD